MIELDVVHLEKTANRRIDIATIRRGDLPGIRSQVRVSVDGYEYYVCPGLERHQEDCEATGACRGDWKVRLRRA